MLYFVLGRETRLAQQIIGRHIKSSQNPDGKGKIAWQSNALSLNTCLSQATIIGKYGLTCTKRSKTYCGEFLLLKETYQDQLLFDFFHNLVPSIDLFYDDLKISDS